VRIGFIGGCGHHYLKNVPKSDARPSELQLAVASDGRDIDAARRFASSLSEATWFDDAETMLREFGPEVVSVGAVHGFNGDFARAALARDIAVVSDKPIAASWPHFHALAEQSRKTKRPLITELPTRWDPAYDAAQKAIAAGRIGAIATARALRSYRFGTRPAWYADRASFAGLFLWVGTHEVDVVRFVTGQSTSVVAARHANIAHPDFGSMEDCATCLLSLDKGGTAVVAVDYLRPATAPTHGDVSLRLAGAAGVLEVRPGSCRFTTNSQITQEIAPESMPVPFHHELLDVAMGKSSDRFGTEQSLSLAELMLKIRDVADQVDSAE
jgi:predicted dehydrogenase